MNSRLRYRLICPIATDPLREEKYSIIEKLEQAYDCSVSKPQLQQYAYDLEKDLDDLGSHHAIIVDLSLARPSCYFELGLCEALRLVVYPIAAVGTEIHQYSGNNGVRFFENLNSYEQLLNSILSSHSTNDVPK